VKRGEVVKVVNAGKFDSTPIETVANLATDDQGLIEIRTDSNGKQTIRTSSGEAKAPAKEGAGNFSVSPDGLWLEAYQHLSTGNWVDLYQRQKHGKYAFKASINVDSAIFADAFVFHELKQEDLGDHYGTQFQGWSGKSHLLIVGLHAQLAERGSHGGFYRFGGWTGVYDPDKGQVVEQLTPGSIGEP